MAISISPSILPSALLRLGARPTFAITLFTHRHITVANASPPEGLTVAIYSDGYHNGFNMTRDNPKSYGSETHRRDMDFLTDLIVKAQNDGDQFDCFVYTMLMHWVAEVRDEFRIPSKLLWIQPASVCCIYYTDDVVDPTSSL